MKNPFEPEQVEATKRALQSALYHELISQDEYDSSVNELDARVESYYRDLVQA